MNALLHEMEMFARANISEDVKARLAKRRLVSPGPGMHLYTIRKRPLPDARDAMLTWINQHTTDRFYLGGNLVGFANDKDEMIFRLGFNSD